MSLLPGSGGKAIQKNGVAETLNTDQGSRFTGVAFTVLLQSHAIRGSMGRGRQWRQLLCQTAVAQRGVWAPGSNVFDVPPRLPQTSGRKNTAARAGTKKQVLILLDGRKELHRRVVGGNAKASDPMVHLKIETKDSGGPYH